MSGTSESQSPPSLASDAPIREREDDLFGRDRIARRIATEAVSAPGDAGFVIALTGRWGSGKTSLANLVEERLEQDDRATFFSFNPWLFSGAEDLVGRFFAELAAALGKREGRLQQVARKLAKYAGALSEATKLAPPVGAQVSAVLKGLERLAVASGEAPSLQDRQGELASALREFDGRIVVLLDDIDRLLDEEIREIVRLVKLVGDLPRLTYVLAFDRERVEQALGAPEADPEQRRERGRAYLEKIVQSRHDVPPLRAATIARVLAEQLTDAVAPYPDRHLHEADWHNMLGLALREMVVTPRDAKRVANALPAAIEVLGDEVALADVIGLEALRVLEPDVHAGLSTASDTLLGDGWRLLGDRERRREEDRERVDELLGRARFPRATRTLLGQLFPGGADALEVRPRARANEGEERRDRRVAMPEVLRTYLHATLDDDTLATAEVERVSALLDDPEGLGAALRDHSGAVLADLIDRLTDCAQSFRPEHAVGAAAVLMASEPRLASGDTHGRWSLHRLVGLLLLSEADEARRATIAEELFEAVEGLSERLRVVNWFGTHPDREHRDADAEMLDEVTTTRLNDEIRRAVPEADAADLAREPMVRELLLGLLHPDEDAGRLVAADKLRDDRLFLASLRASYGHRSSLVVGEAAVRRTPYVSWTILTRLLGEDELRRRVVTLDASIDQAATDPETRAALRRAAAIARGEIERDPDLE